MQLYQDGQKSPDNAHDRCQGEGAYLATLDLPDDVAGAGAGAVNYAVNFSIKVFKSDVSPGCHI